MKKLSYKIALGGVIASIAVLSMFLTGFGPFLTYICPMFAGMLMIMIIIEVSQKWAFATYVAVSILSVFMTPDREAAMLFIFLFGHYPILKVSIEKIKSHFLEWILKIAVFNICVISCYWIILNIFMPNVLDSLSEWGKYGALIFLGLANLTFILYDFFLGSAATLYCKWFRTKFLRKFKK